PPPTIPRMRYVQVALASQDVGGAQTSTSPTALFLIEEFIDETQEGDFRKYINNRTPVPVEFPDDDVANQDRSLFLAFAQHWQYKRTHGLVFVSDFQGKYSFGLSLTYS
ncbi:hypothetical protein C8R44DRAFT_605639, partial [Mycena epipterygia]